MFTRKEVIESYIGNLSGDEMQNVMACINSYDGSFEDAIWYPMDELDEFLEGKSPLDILQMAHFGDFNPTDEYFQFDAYGNLQSADGWQINRDAPDYTGDIIEWCVNSSVGETCDDTLDFLINSDRDTLFNEDYEEIDME